MTLKIENEEVERIVRELVAITGESKTEAVRIALEERRQRIALRESNVGKRERLTAFLQDEIWSQIPPVLLGKTLSKAKEEEILVYGEDDAKS